MPAHPGVIRPAAETQIISVITQRRAAERPRAQVHEMEIAGVPSTAEYMSIGETTTRFGNCSARRRSGMNIGGRGDATHHAGEAAVDRRDELRIAQPQVVVCHAAAARQQIERELRPLLIDVARQALEPLERRLRGALRALDDRPALGLVGRERGGHVVAGCAKRPRQRDRVLHRELGPRTDREVRRVRRVAEQHDVAAHQRR